ncbi:LLM class flavin-dependent oxidoreductase [Nocardia sp. CA-129566]|uniref:LLM class flavin-dependent oxidoreductase n=1 Tax=Nocardia sp. CA-129566 TaxID=3239976 RepID=UPI003D9660AE
MSDGRMQRDETPILGSPNAFKLAVFGPNCSGGCSMTSGGGEIAVSWAESKKIAVAADEAGIEAIIPVARWRGFGGATDFNGRSFETFAWAAGLAAITERIQVFSTWHVPTAHPVRVAKEVATIDHISGGRFGLNLVAGWVAKEIEMFGLTQREHDVRYDYAAEVFEVLERLWTETEPFDHEGKFLRIPKGFSEPKPIQVPYPAIMSAGVSPRGRDFAAKYADVSFILVDNLDTAAKMVADTQNNARTKYGRELSVFGMGHIVCADTEAEAKRLYRHYVHDHGDWSGVDNLLAALIPNQDVGRYERQALAENLIAGWGALPLVGTPEQVVAGMQEMAASGLAGITLSWFDYQAGLGQFREQILPLMEEAGLRAPAGTAAVRAGTVPANA